MARALMPVKTTSAHWLAHPAFADAVEQFLAREGGIEATWSTWKRARPSINEEKRRGAALSSVGLGQPCGCSFL